MSHAKVGLLVFKYAYQINRISVKRCNSVLRMITKKQQSVAACGHRHDTLWYFTCAAEYV